MKDRARDWKQLRRAAAWRAWCLDPWHWVLGLLASAFLVGAAGSAPETNSLHWSLQPLRSAEAPKTKNTKWARTSVDSFILAALEARGMAPSPSADKGTLLRRVTFDLTGLPPTPEETRAFLADKSPKAFEKVVDRLLASPHYGERWARHWMDVVHFAETHGNDQDRIRTNAWPYRDYLIRAFNEDKPYARFVQEQLAGDVLFPDDPQATVALGFIAAGPWDESSLRDIREDTIDRQIGRYLDRDDMVTTTMSTFASATVHCARCHDHKFDPVSQEDYYSLQAVFAGVDRADRVFDADPKVHSTRQALLKQRRRGVDGGASRTADAVRSGRMGEVRGGQRGFVDGTRTRVVRLVERHGARETTRPFATRQRAASRKGHLRDHRAQRAEGNHRRAPGSSE
jgi:hypothetical protein